MAGTLLLRNINRFHSAKNVWFISRNISNHQLNPSLLSSYTTINSSKTSRRFGSTNSGDKNEVQLSMREKLKKAVAEYGSTVIVFHVAISLTSLGACYLIVSSGLDVTKFITPLGINGETAVKVASGAGTFAVAYAVHKIFAPVRIMITLTATPFIVRYLRNIGVLRKTK